MSDKLPTLKNTWEISANNVAATSVNLLDSYQKSLFVIKNTLVNLSSNPWSVHSSSNSVNYTGDDQIIALPMPDQSPSGFDGVPVGIEDSNITSDIPGGAFSTSSMTFNTSNEYVTMGNVLGFDKEDSFSISFWFKKNAGGSTWAITKYTGAVGYYIQVLAAGNILVRFNNPNRIEVNTTAGGFDDNAWHHVAFTYDGSEVAAGVNIYVDNTDEALTVVADTLSTSMLNSNSFNISGFSNGIGEFGGKIDDVAVYNKQLTSGEVSTIYNSGIPNNLILNGPDGYLVGYWLMGDTGITSETPGDTWFQSTNLIWATEPAIHSWIVLQHPKRSLQVLFDCNQSSVSGRISSMLVSFGGNFSGGDNNNRPRACDEISAGDGQQWLGPIVSSFDSWVHVWQSSDGYNTRVHVSTSSGTGQGMFWLFDKFETNSDLWFEPQVALIALHKGTSGGSVFNLNNWMTTDSGSNLPGQILGVGNRITLLGSPLNDPTIDYFSNRSIIFNKPGTTQNEYITMGNVGELEFDRLDSFSISFWFRALPHSTDTSIISKRSFGGTNIGYDIQYLSTGKLVWELCNNSAGDIASISTDLTFIDANWHHVVCTYDGTSNASGLLIYIDGSLTLSTIDDDTLTGTIVTVDAFNISGVDNGTSREFFGSIADTSVFNIELTSGEITTIYNNGIPTDLRLEAFNSNLVGYWLMGDGDRHTIIKDRSNTTSILAASLIVDRTSNGNDGTPTNMEDADFTTDTPGGISGFSSTLDGVDEDIRFGNVTDLQFEHTDQFSCSCWVKFTSTSGVIVGKMLPTVTERGWSISAGASGVLSVILRNNAAGSLLTQVTTINTGFNDGAWHHVALTWDGISTQVAANITFYIDNINQSLTTNSDNLTGTISSTAEFIIGSRTSDYWAGQIDDVAIYNKVLTLTEVSNLYNSGVPTDNTLLKTEFNLVGYWGLGESHNDGTMVNMEDVDIKGDSPSNPLLLFKLGSQNCATGIGTLDMVTERAAVNVPNELDTLFPTITDLSPSFNNGTATNMDTLDISGYTPGGVSEYSLLFDGSNDHVVVGDVAELKFDVGDAFSISVWINTSVSASIQRIVSKRLNGGVNTGYDLALEVGGELSFQFIDDSTVPQITRVIDTAATNLADGIWHHVAITKGLTEAGNDINLYIDGNSIAATVSDDTFIGNGGTSFDTTTPFQIGSINGTGSPFNGRIDDVAVYNKELTSGEILAIHNDSVPTDLSLDSGLVGYWLMGDSAGVPAFPIVPISVISGYGYRGMHGFIDDLWWGSDALTSDPGTTYPKNSNIRKLAQSNDVIMPWTGDSTTPFFGINTVQPYESYDGHFTGIDDSPSAQVQYYQMIGIDSGAPIYPTYTSWVVRDIPDANALQATPDFGPVINVQISAKWIEDI